MIWHRSFVGRCGLRLLGCVLLVGGYLAGRQLMTFSGYAGSPPPIVYLLALTTFLCFSSGSALTVIGHRLFERAERRSRL
jgi:hypothetical protein